MIKTIHRWVSSFNPTYTLVSYRRLSGIKNPNLHRNDHALIQINIPTQHAIVQGVTRNAVLFIGPRDKILIFALG